MFPPSSSVNPFSYSNQTMFKEPNTNEQNLNPTPNPNSPSFLFPFPNSFLTQNNGALETHFVSQSLENMDTVNTIIKEKLPRTRRTRKFVDGENRNPYPNPSKRTGKSDRHSKIYTEKGPRERRMRLSVPIARKFFDLQDILGFDKASKTIEWLFSQSKAAITELALNNEPQVSINRSYLSNCENGFENGFKLGEDNDGELGKVVQVSQANESRVNARSRARERTREKLKEVGTCEGYPKFFEELGFLKSLDQEKQFPLQEAGMIENFMGATSSSALNSIFDFDKDILMLGGVDSSDGFMGIFGNLDIMVPLTGNIVQEQNPNSDSFIQFESHFQ